MSPFGTVSMPGTFRKVKTKCFGPSKMPNDPLQAQRDDVMAFDSLLASLNSTAKIVASAVNMLASAPLPLSEELAKFYPQDVPGASTVARMCAQMKDFANKAGQASMHIEQIHQLIGELSKQNASVREAFKARDLAWQTQAHYNNKVDGLHDQVSRVSAASPKVGDKLHRNLAKKLDSAQALDLQMSQTIDLANRALAPKWQRTSDVLTKLCRYYIMVFEASGVLSAELREVVQELCGPKTAEAMVLRGQELANKARARISSTQFGRGVRDKLGVGDGGGAGGGAPAAAAAAAAAADGSGDAGGGSSGSFMRSGSGSGGGGGGGGGGRAESKEGYFSKAWGSMGSSGGGSSASPSPTVAMAAQSVESPPNRSSGSSHWAGTGGRGSDAQPPGSDQGGVWGNFPEWPGGNAAQSPAQAPSIGGNSSFSGFGSGISGGCGGVSPPTSSSSSPWGGSPFGGGGGAGGGGGNGGGGGGGGGGSCGMAQFPPRSSAGIAPAPGSGAGAPSTDTWAAFPQQAEPRKANPWA